MSVTLAWSDGDLVIDEAGRAVEVSGQNKTSQDVAEALLMTLDPRRGYGSRLGNMQMPAVESSLIGRSLVATEVTETIDRLRALQNRDPTCTPDERVRGIASLRVIEQGQSSYAFYAAVETENRTPIPVSPIIVTAHHTWDRDSEQALGDFAETLGGEVG